MYLITSFFHFVLTVSECVHIFISWFLRMLIDQMQLMRWIQYIWPPIWGTVDIVFEFSLKNITKHWIIKFKFKTIYLIIYVCYWDMFTKFIQYLQYNNRCISILLKLKQWFLSHLNDQINYFLIINYICNFIPFNHLYFTSFKSIDITEVILE